MASLPYKPQFTVMPEGWDGTARDPDEVHYEISMREDEMLYQEFVERMNFNKMQVSSIFSLPLSSLELETKHNEIKLGTQLLLYLSSYKCEIRPMVFHPPIIWKW